MAAPEIVVPFPALDIPPATQVRSTLITTSLQSIRNRGHFDRYKALVPRAQLDEILVTVAGMWVSLELGEAHYAACEALALPKQEQLDIGRDVSDRVQKTMLGVALRTARQAGASPWTGLTMCAKLYERMFVGGGTQLSKIGPKDARLATVNNALFRFSYFRNGYRGVVAAGTELFCTKAYVNELPLESSANALVLRISWA